MYMAGHLPMHATLHKHILLDEKSDKQAVAK